MIYMLTEEEAEQYANTLGLSDQIARDLANGKLKFERIRDSANQTLETTVERLDDRAACTYLFSPSGLAADGFILHHDGEDVGCCILYAVANEKKSGLPEAYVEVRERAQWDEIAKYLSTQFGREINEDDLHHLYDCAIVEEERCNGLGRLISKYSLDTALPAGQISVGFIDPGDKHVDSLVSAMKGRRVIGKEKSPSPDGFHSSFITMFSNDMEIEYTGKEINYRHNEDEISKLPEAIREIVNSGGLVGYNPSTQRFEEVKIKS